MRTLTLAVVILLPASAFGWGEDGHRAVSRIAEMHLTDKAKAAIRDLLRDADPKRDAITDPLVCLWPDMIRGQAAYKTKYPDNQTWHYINLDIADDKPDPVKACVNDNCTLGAIERFRKVVNDKNVPIQDRREALYFLVHFVGDLHQPLHCGSRNDDKGGNRVRVTYPGEKPTTDYGPLNLHWVWDSHLVKASMNGLTWEDYAKRLNDKIPAEDQAAWVQTGVADWIVEGHGLAKKHAYFGIPNDWPLDGKPFAITAEYVKQATPVVELRIQQGGIRLAKVLNNAFE
jgi:hypothetical protein